MKSGLQQLVRPAGLSIRGEERQPRYLRQEGKAIGAEMELEELLATAGSALSQSFSSLDEILSLLDRIEGLLSKVEQSPADSMQTALSKLMGAIITEDFLKHSDVDVKVGVASCISEIIRITAPVAPYDDDKMKEIFQLIVSVFEDFSDTTGRSYFKRVSMLETMAKVRYCVIMLDLECNQMIVEMFEHFLRAEKVHHSNIIFESMAAVMALVLEESEDMAPALLIPIMAIMTKNEGVLQSAKKLVEEVIQKCAEKLGSYLTQALQTSYQVVTEEGAVVASNTIYDKKQIGLKHEEREHMGWISTIVRNPELIAMELIIGYSGRKAANHCERSVRLGKEMTMTRRDTREMESWTAQEIEGKYMGYIFLKPKIVYWKEEEAHGPFIIIRARDFIREFEEQIVGNMFGNGSKREMGQTQWVVEDPKHMGYYFLRPIVEEEIAHENIRSVQTIDFGKLLNHLQSQVTSKSRNEVGEELARGWGNGIGQLGVAGGWMAVGYGAGSVAGSEALKSAASRRVRKWVEQAAKLLGQVGFIGFGQDGSFLCQIGSREVRWAHEINKGVFHQTDSSEDEEEVAQHHTDSVFHEFVACDALGNVGVGLKIYMFPGVFWSFTYFDEILHVGNIGLTPVFWFVAQLIAIEVMGVVLYKLVSACRAECNRQQDDDTPVIEDEVDKNIGIGAVGAQGRMQIDFSNVKFLIAGSEIVMDIWGRGYGGVVQEVTTLVKANDVYAPLTMLTSDLLVLGLSFPNIVINGSYADSHGARVWAFYSILVSYVETGDQAGDDTLNYVDQELVSTLKVIVQQIHPVGEDEKGSSSLIIVGVVLKVSEKRGLLIDGMGTNAGRGACDKVKMLRLLVCEAGAKDLILVDEEYVTMQDIKTVELCDSFSSCMFLGKNRRRFEFALKVQIFNKRVNIFMITKAWANEYPLGFQYFGSEHCNLGFVIVVFDVGWKDAEFVKDQVFHVSALRTRLIFKRTVLLRASIFNGPNMGPNIKGIGPRVPKASEESRCGGE